MKTRNYHSSDQICFLIPGAYLGVSTDEPKRVIVRDKTLVTIVEDRDDDFVVAMIDCQNMILVHKDAIEKIQ